MGIDAGGEQHWDRKEEEEKEQNRAFERPGKTWFNAS
jgi:hypothetical protein